MAKWTQDLEDMEFKSNKSSDEEVSDEKDGDDKFDKALNMISGRWFRMAPETSS